MYNLRIMLKYGKFTKKGEINERNFINQELSAEILKFLKEIENLNGISYIHNKIDKYFFYIGIFIFWIWAYIYRIYFLYFLLGLIVLFYIYNVIKITYAKSIFKSVTNIYFNNQIFQRYNLFKIDIVNYYPNYYFISKIKIVLIIRNLINNNQNLNRNQNQNQNRVQNRNNILINMQDIFSRTFNINNLKNLNEIKDKLMLKSVQIAPYKIDMSKLINA